MYYAIHPVFGIYLLLQNNLQLNFTKEKTDMINFAFCYERHEDLDFVLKCFHQRDVEIAVKCYHNAHELIRCIDCNCPDILFYDMEDGDGLMRNAVLRAKRANKKLISIITKGDYTPPAEDVLLEPMYVLPDKSRKCLWQHAALAYETILDDPDSFSYYVRPEYFHIPVNEIRYFASEGRRTHVVSADRRDSFYQKLDVVETGLRQKSCEFLRISKYEYYRSLNEHLQARKRTKAGRRPQYPEW